MTSISTALIARHGRTILAITGDLDTSGVDYLRDTVDHTVRIARGRIEIDLSRVTYLDAPAAAILAAGHDLADQLAKPYIVTGAHSAVRDALRAAGIPDHLTNPGRFRAKTS
jgi:anti-anti-sigma factor